jgi:hypothetical protein
MPLKPQRFGDLPDGLNPYHRDFLGKLRDAIEILIGAKRSQTDTASPPRSQAVTFSDLDAGAVENVSTHLPEYANNAAAVAAGKRVGGLYRTGDTLKVVH